MIAPAADGCKRLLAGQRADLFVNHWIWILDQANRAVIRQAGVRSGGGFYRHPSESTRLHFVASVREDNRASRGALMQQCACCRSAWAVSKWPGYS